MYEITSSYVEKKDYIVAIDLGSSSATIAVGSRDAGGQLDILDIVSCPMTTGISRGQIANRQEVISVLEKLREQIRTRHGISISDAYTGVSGKHIKCATRDYYVYVGERSEGEIRKEDLQALHAVMNNVQAEEGERILDRIPQSYLIDGQEKVKDPVGRFGAKLSSTFCFVLGSRVPIDRLEKALQSVGIEPRRTFPNALLSARAVTTEDEREMGVAVLDIGAGTSDLCICHDGSVRFVRGIPMGADDINNDIKQQGILERHVEALKTKFGRAVKDNIDKDQLIVIAGLKGRDQKKISQRNLAVIIENRLKDITRFVREEIKESGYAGSLGAGLVLTGGCTRLPDIEMLFRQELGMDVRIAAPDLYVNQRSRELAANPEYATVIGMLLRVMDSGERNSVEIFDRPRPLVTKKPEQTPPPKPRTVAPREPAAVQPPVPVPEPEPEPRLEEDDMDEKSDEKQERKKRFGRVLGVFRDKMRGYLDVLEDDEDDEEDL